ncbi:MAG: hypothetical protein AB7D33_10325 [Sphingobium sp.]
MADAPDLPTAPAKKPRRAPTRKASAAGTSAKKTGSASTAKKAATKAEASTPRKRAPRAKAAATPSFAESANQARAAMTTASAAARAKMKEVADKTSVDWKAQSEKLKNQGEKVKAQSEQIYAQAGKMARDAADSAKARTGTAMQSLAKLIDETAGTVDTKLGPQYGDYARQAANAVAGAAQSLDDKDIDQLLGEARDFVRKSPAVAIGAAAIAGFVLMRLARGSGSAESNQADEA